MLSYGYWQRRFRRRSGRGGRTIQLTHSACDRGAMPRGFKVVSYDFDLLVPAAFDPVKQSLPLCVPLHGRSSGRYDLAGDADVARLLNVWMTRGRTVQAPIRTGI